MPVFDARVPVLHSDTRSHGMSLQLFASYYNVKHNISRKLYWVHSHVCGRLDMGYDRVMRESFFCTTR
jgi:hypothetical protein